MSRLLTLIVLIPIACATFSGCGQVVFGGRADSPSALAMANHGLVKESLNQLIAAYEAKDNRRFSELVSERYTGDESILDTAVRRDFSTYHNLTIQYTVNNITLDSDGGKAVVAITYTRGWTEIKTSKTRSETRETSLVFIRENGVYKLYSQNRPLLFGLN